nr:hypothetical protein [uncultured Actinoplanes sp.]
MGIDLGWRRIAPQAAAGRTPEDLAELVPSPFDDQYARMVEDRRVVWTDDQGVLVGVLLSLCTEGTPYEAGAQAFAQQPPDFDDEEMTGTLDPGTVREIAAAMAVAEWRTWLRAQFDLVMTFAADAGMDPVAEGAAPEGPWADHFVRFAEELTDLFGRASADGEAVVVMIDA